MSKIDIQILLKRAHNGDKASRNQILIDNTGLIWSIVKRFLNRGHESEDLFQIGCIGMLKAIDRFDSGFHVAFSTYAVPMITGEIRRFLRDDGIIKISRTIKENQKLIFEQREQYISKNHAEPTIEQLSSVCRLSKEEIITAMEAAREVESIDKEMDYTEGSGQTLIEKIEDTNNMHNAVLNRIFMRQILDMLDEKQQKIIIMRYYQNKTQSEVAHLLGMSQVQVSRMEKKILNYLREQIT